MKTAFECGALISSIAEGYGANGNRKGINMFDVCLHLVQLEVRLIRSHAECRVIQQRRGALLGVEVEPRLTSACSPKCTWVKLSRNSDGSVVPQVVLSVGAKGAAQDRRDIIVTTKIFFGTARTDTHNTRGLSR